MYIKADTLDDLLRRVFRKLLASKVRIRPTKGAATELTSVLLRIDNPRARLSRTQIKGTVFSCLGELLWYLAKSNDLKFISYYLKHYKKFSDDGRTIYGAYGPRMFRMRNRIDQFKNVIRLLKKKPNSRQAVIQLFDAKDIIRKHKDVPCTCTLQFMIRGGRLHMLTNMRSNDAFLGLPHDIFAFTMLQEILARSLGVGLGQYSHAVGSLHLYKDHRQNARLYLREGWQPTLPMPRIPGGDPWACIRKVVKAERAIRGRKHVRVDQMNLRPYWKDLIRLLQVFAYSKRGQDNRIIKVKSKMSADLYHRYIDERMRMSSRTS